MDRSNITPKVLFIAATAIMLSVPIISNNKRHYPFEGLEVCTAREWKDKL